MTTPYTVSRASANGGKVLSFRAAQRRARREKLYVLFALTPQYMALGALALYALLRLLLTPHVPFTCYTGPLFLLWPAAYVLLLVSYVADKLLWDD